MKIKLFVKNNHYLNKIIEPIYKVIFNLPNKIKIGFRKHPSMLAGELHLFESIFKQCSTIVDVGARYDVDYIRISSGRGIKYFLFEANPQYSAKLSRKLNKYNDEIFNEQKHNEQKHNEPKYNEPKYNEKKYDEKKYNEPKHNEPKHNELINSIEKDMINLINNFMLLKNIK